MKLEELTKDELIYILLDRCPTVDFAFDILMRRIVAIEEEASVALASALSAREESAELLRPYSVTPLADIPASVIDEAEYVAKAGDAAMRRYNRLSKQARSIQTQLSGILKKPGPGASAVESNAPEPIKPLVPVEPEIVQLPAQASPAVVPAVSRAATKKPTLYSGFVHIRCDRCHKETTTCLRTPTREYICRACGQKTELADLTRAYISCECGAKGRYLTNIGDWMFDIPCRCGMPNAVKYLPVKDVYVPADQIPQRLKPKEKR